MNNIYPLRKVDKCDSLDYANANRGYTTANHFQTGTQIMNKFEQQFDEGLDITDLLDVSKAKRVLQEQKRVNVDFPTWMIESLDREARKLGVTRQSVIKVWLAERLEKTTI